MAAGRGAPTRVMVVNSGSSSIKFALVDTADGTTVISGLVEQIGEPQGGVRLHLPDGVDHAEQVHVTDHRHGFELVVKALEARGLVATIDAFGHRVVHGGSRFTAPTVIDEAVITAIEDLVPLAPLHNPANLDGIRAAMALRPDLPHVAVFDTAFHRTMPPEAEQYALPIEVAEAHGIRRYGFHGTSHAYVARRAAEHLGIDPDQLDAITLHLGNGASAAAIAGGRSVDTSMGLSPLEGLVMGTRSGDLDPAVVFHLVRHAGLSLDEVDTLLNRRSGLLGLAGVNDMRTVEARMADGDEAARLAFAVCCRRVRKYIGAYLAVLGRADAVVFTGGIGEHSAAVRAAVCRGLDGLGITLDERRNAGVPEGARAHRIDGGGPVAVLVVRTDEEHEIASQTVAALAR